jgi:hypothetical protein
VSVDETMTWEEAHEPTVVRDHEDPTRWLVELHCWCLVYGPYRLSATTRAEAEAEAASIRCCDCRPPEAE